MDISCRCSCQMTSLEAKGACPFGICCLLHGRSVVFVTVERITEGQTKDSVRWTPFELTGPLHSTTNRGKERGWVQSQPFRKCRACSLSGFREAGVMAAHRFVDLRCGRLL